MKFGKLESLTGVDFHLPPDPPQNAAVLAALPRLGQPALYVGPTGYNMKEWVGKWYPTGAKDKDFLRYYGTQFNTIEHNTTHYRIPDAATVTRWREETPADFRFCPKIPQTISHAHDMGLHDGQIPFFAEMIRGLADKMGCCFLQLPPYFSIRDLPTLQRFLQVFPRDLPLAVEARHESFFQNTPNSEAFFQLLADHGVSSVITDVAGRRDVCHLRLTNARVLLRFVGNDLQPTDYTRIAAWAERLAAWFDGGLQEAYLFTHEPDNILAPELSAYCAEVFAARMPGVQLRGPHPVAPPVRQGTLF